MFLNLISGCHLSAHLANYNGHMTSVMNNLNTLVSLNGIAANVQVAQKLIGQDDRRLSELQIAKDGMIQTRTAQELILRAIAKARRDDLMRQIAEVDSWEINQLEQLSAAFDTSQAPLDEKIKLLTAHINAAKAAIAPIRILPAELLGNVFREFVGLDQPPFVLTLVSKSWKQTVLTTPWLWRHLGVGGPTRRWSLWRVGGRKCYTSGNRLICYDVEDLRMWADMSGRVPLDVELSKPRAGQDDELLQYLLGERLSSRIQSLSISLSIPNLNVQGLNFGRFPLLSKFSIRSHYHNAAGPLITSILTRSSQVDEFTSHSLLTDFLPGHKFWNSIRVLSLGEYLQSSQLNQIVGVLTVVETIRSPDNWPDITTPTATLKHVKHISVRCQPEFLARLRLPRLETLFLTDPESWTRHYGRTTPVSGQLDRSWQISMPQLVKLTIISMDATWLSRLFAPELQTMSWKGIGRHPAVQTAFPHIQFPKVETFSFDAECSDKILRSAVDCVPNVQALSLSPGVSKICSDKWGLAFLGRLTDSEEFPGLRRLTLGTYIHRVGTNKNLAKPLIKALIESRKQGRTPIEHLEVAWTRRTHREETIQYVN